MFEKTNLGATSEQEFSSEEKARARFLEEMLSRELYYPDTAGYRGVSIEDLKFFVKEGRLPSKQAQEEVQGGETQSNLYFFPKAVYQLQPSEIQQRDKRDKNDEFYIEGAEDYAKISARRIEFCKIAGLPFNKKSFDLVSELGDFSPQDVTFFLKGPVANHPDILSLRTVAGLTDDEKLSEICSKVYEATKKYKGVVFALHKDIFADYEIHKGDEETDGDMYIHVPEGLDMKYISGLRLVGEGEKEYFKEVEGKVQ